MAFVTHFKDTDGQQLPIAASTLVTVEIPAAGSADKGDWHQAAQDTTAHYNQQAAVNAPKNSAVIPHCTDPSVFTDHGLRIEYEEQLQGWVLWIDSLPETACTLTLLFINHSTEGTPVVLPALGGGGGGNAPSGGGLPVLDLTTAFGTQDEPAILSAEETAKVSAAASANMPLVVRFSYNGVAISALFDLMHGAVYVHMLEETSVKFGFTLVADDDVWYAVLEIIPNA